MKSNFFFALLTFLIAFSSFGQCDVCTPDLTCSSATGSPAICPAQIPDATEGVLYNQQVTFYLPSTVSFNGSDFELQDVVITSINGLPAGIDVFFPNNDTTFSPGTGENHACVTLCGTAFDTGVYIVQIVIDGTVNTVFGPFEFPTQIFTFDFNVLANSSITTGCTNELACNFDSLAIEDDGSCGPILGSVCDDSDSTTSADVINADCICQGTPDVFGCTDTSACNFNAFATVDDFTCGSSIGSACDDGDTTTFNDVITNGCACAGIQLISGCTDISACNFNPEAIVDDGSCGIALGSLCDDGDSTTSDDVIVEGCVCTGLSEIAGCTSFFSCNFNPDATIDDGSCLGFFGSPCDDGDSSTINDQVNFDCTCLGSPIIEGCTDPGACNYDAAANVDNGSCAEAIGSPCDDGDLNTSNDAIVSGCSCEGVTGIPGCTDFFACNFNPQATIDDGSCGPAIGSPCDDGDATTANDITLPGCDCMGIPALAGCMNPLACNYNPLAVTDDGSCGPPTGEPCDDGDSNTADDVIIIGCLCIGNPLAIGDLDDAIANMLVYPNPANQFVVLDIPIQFTFRFRFVNMTGQTMLSGYNERRIDVSPLSTGLYFLSIDLEDSKYNRLIEIRR